MKEDSRKSERPARSVRPSEVRVALLGDAVSGYAKHTRLVPAIEIAARAIGSEVEVEWVPTTRLARNPSKALNSFDGVVAAPQSVEYCRSPAGLLDALRHVRRQGTCCLAICGGAQFALREQASRIPEDTFSGPVLEEGSCAIARSESTHGVSGAHAVEIASGSLAGEAYGQREVVEHFACNHLPTPEAEAQLRRIGLRVVGTTPGVGACLFERSEHPFYVASLYLPHMHPDQPHPLFVAFLRTAEAPSAQKGSWRKYP